VSGKREKEFEVRESNLKLTSAVESGSTESSGRVRHDERGVAVWDWAVDTDVLEELSASAVMRRLDTPDLKLQESPGLALSIAGRDAGGGGDPYNSRCAERRASTTRRKG
jgi:hypothetical protein